MVIVMYTTTELFDLEHTLAKDYLAGYDYPWQALKGIKDLILKIGPTLGDEYTEVSPGVWVHKTATVAPTAIWVHPASSVPERKCATVPLSGKAPWWAKTVWWAIPWN